VTVKPTIHVDFCDFNGVDKFHNYFTGLLSRKYDIRMSDRPDLLIYSSRGDMHRLYNCRKVFWTDESIRPDFSQCDYAVTCFYIDDPHHLRLPYYVVWGGLSGRELLKTQEEIDTIVASKRKFCSFLVTNVNPHRAGKRIRFFEKLSRYKKVDSGGKALNNIGRVVPEGACPKFDFIKEYKFNLCFENKSMEGYTTEKLVDAMWARCIPIYWGNPLVGREFNTRSFLSLHDCRDDEELIEKIIEIDRDDEQYRRLLAEPYFPNNEVNEYFDENRILDFFEKILSDPAPPVSHRRRYFHLGRWRLARMMRYHGD
jgi:hypothetical protein